MVFISYTNALPDSAIAKAADNFFELNRVEHFSSYDIPMGEHWSARIDLELNRCNAMIAIASASARGRSGMFEELATFCERMSMAKELQLRPFLVGSLLSVPYQIRMLIRPFQYLQVPDLTGLALSAWISSRLADESIHWGLNREESRNDYLALARDAAGRKSHEEALEYSYLGLQQRPGDAAILKLLRRSQDELMSAKPLVLPGPLLIGSRDALARVLQSPTGPDVLFASDDSFPWIHTFLAKHAAHYFKRLRDTGRGTIPSKGEDFRRYLSQHNLISH